MEMQGTAQGTHSYIHYKRLKETGKFLWGK